MKRNKHNKSSLKSSIQISHKKWGYLTLSLLLSLNGWRQEDIFKKFKEPPHEYSMMPSFGHYLNDSSDRFFNFYLWFKKYPAYF